MTKIATIVGARPQFIKCAPVSRKLQDYAVEVVVHTGQHYDDNMSGIFFRQLEIKPPKYNLEVGSGTHGQQTADMLKGVETVLQIESPDLVLLYGDTNSTLAGALAAAKLNLPIAHVEAGLRSFNHRMPEEINRIVTDHVASLLFCPTETAVENLAREGITAGVALVGDVMYDALCDHLALARRRSCIIEQLNLVPGKYYLATIHRAENTNDRRRLGAIIEALVTIAKRDRRVVLPLHPGTRKMLPGEMGSGSCPELVITEPVSYLDMLMLEDNAHAILTDSGGVQREAYWLSVPCITLREETEWIETLESEWNYLAGADTKRICEHALRLERRSRRKRRVAAVGEASARIAEALLAIEQDRVSPAMA